jgi:predicted nucleic acid-binding Zn ribbon protein
MTDIMWAMKRCEMDGCNKEARRRFCSETCQKKWHNARRKKRPKHQHVCVVCKMPFEGRADAKVCSNKCQVRLHRFKTVKVRVPKNRPRTGVTIEIDSDTNNVSAGKGRKKPA